MLAQEIRETFFKHAAAIYYLCGLLWSLGIGKHYQCSVVKSKHMNVEVFGCTSLLEGIMNLYELNLH